MIRWRWEAMAEVVRSIDPKVGAEIGVKKGHFSAHLLNQYPELKMIAVDPWEEQPDGNETYQEWNMPEVYREFCNRMKPFSGRVIVMRTYSDQAAKVVEDGSLDFVFIDAQHDYESVCKDIDTWKSKVRPGGILSGHDYDARFPGVIKAVDERFKPNIASNAVWWVKC